MSHGVVHEIASPFVGHVDLVAVEFGDVFERGFPMSDVLVCLLGKVHVESPFELTAWNKLAQLTEDVVKILPGMLHFVAAMVINSCCRSA